MFYIYENGVISKVLIPDGYLTPAGTGFTYHFYIKDHQGNVRVVMNRSRQIEQANHYYPFGGLFAASTAGAVQNYKYSGKELDRMNGLDLYDFSARGQDPMMGRFTTMDPLCEKYYSISPYAYCANNPVNSIDPDGRLIIFINGLHAGSEGGSPLYWNNGRRSFDASVMRHFNDYNSPYYFDGSLGGAFKGVTIGLSGPLRFSEGYENGQKYASEIISRLSRNSNGYITEALRIVSHSMGAMYAKGFIAAILDFVSIYPESCNGLMISEYDFAPFQTGNQRALEGVSTFQFSHEDDRLARNSPINGSVYMDTSSDEDQGHSLWSFYDQINNLPEGIYKFEHGKIVKASDGWFQKNNKINLI